MKTHACLTAVALTLVLLPSCDRESPESARIVADLERRNQKAEERQAELERQLADQKLAAEMEAIERERASIDEERAELEQQAGERAVEQERMLREREAEMATREGNLDRLRVSLEEKEEALGTRETRLTERDRELAGREALNPESSDPGEPVGDYGTFYDSLSSYGSWFETGEYGYVWQPAVVREVGWRPYSRGRWVCSDRGWTWISEEPFGWATYHYGRWALLRGRGWIWVPGSEWAPCWVSWRESDSHIGWAPLPPETLAWRGNGWDSSVDVRFGIGAAWFNFVEIWNFGGPVYRHCLPVSGNIGWYGSTTNITYIHVRNAQIICGGPRYDRINKRVGRPVPFYRLEMDRHPRLGRDLVAPRPLVRGDRLRVSAPNLDARWNEGLRPPRVRGRLDQVTVERERQLEPEIRERFRQSRVEGRQRAEKVIEEQGGRERFEEMRRGRMQPGKLPEREVSRGIARQESTPRREVARSSDAPRPGRVDVKSNPLPGRRLPDGVTRRAESKEAPAGRINGSGGNGAAAGNRPERRAESGTPAVGRKPDGQVAPPPVPRRDGGRDGAESRGNVSSGREDSRATRNPGRQDQEVARQVQQRRDDEARRAREEAAGRQQAELARQRQQQEKQRQEAQARESRRQAMEQQERQQRAAREEALRRQQAQQQAEARRQEQAREQQREAQRQEQAREQQREARRQEQAREQQREAQRQQEQARQQQERSRQQEQTRQQEQARRQEQSRQEERRQDDSGRRNR